MVWMDMEDPHMLEQAASTEEILSLEKNLIMNAWKIGKEKKRRIK